MTDETEAEIQQLRDDVASLQNIINQWKMNGADSLFMAHSFTFGTNGIERLDDSGIQINTAGGTTPGLRFVPQFYVNPGAVSGLMMSQISGNETSNYAYTQILSGQTGASSLGSEADITITADDSVGGSETSTIQLTTLPKSGASAALLLQMVNGGVQRLLISGGNGSTGPVALQLNSQTIDPTYTISEFMTWGRGDTHKWKVRLNGVTENVAVESWVTAAIAAISPTPWSAQKVLSAASTNGTVIKASAGTLGPFVLVNTNAAARYLHLYNSTTVTVGTTVPALTFAIPPSTTGKALVFNTNTGIPFSTGICFGLSTGAADNDSGAVAANEITGSICWV